MFSFTGVPVGFSHAILRGLILKLKIREPGTVIGERYQITGILGKGGMGCVYGAIQKPIGRRVAVKVVHAELAARSEIVSRFHREAKLAASIGHANICEVTDLGTDSDGSPFLVMPYLDGIPMNKFFETDRPLPVVVSVFSQLLSGLEAAHEFGIVHRDLKPANVFIGKVGPVDHFVKILDFGISKILTQDSVTELTRTGQILGTPFYMSPEQAVDPKAVDLRSDIYAVGVMLYEVLLKRRPFEGGSYAEVLYKIMSEPVAKPSQVVSEFPASVEKIILKSIDRDRGSRYASASELRTALGHCLETGSALPSRSLSPINDDATFSSSPQQPSRHKAADRLPGAASKNIKIALATLAVLLMAALGLVLFVSINKAGDEPAAVAPTPQDIQAPSLPKPKPTTSEPALGKPEVLPDLTYPADESAESEGLPAEKKPPRPNKRVKKEVHRPSTKEDDTPKTQNVGRPKRKIDIGLYGE